LVICFLTQHYIADKTLNGLFEVKSRGAKVLLITNQENVDKKTYDELIYLPYKSDFYLPLISIIPIQLLSYHISMQKGINPDKPRNLAKAVTVE
jgi:glucosamine--fructose-6-phosphate aminotransferase (isomerizing)